MEPRGAAEGHPGRGARHPAAGPRHLLREQLRLHGPRARLQDGHQQVRQDQGCGRGAAAAHLHHREEPAAVGPGDEPRGHGAGGAGGGQDPAARHPAAPRPHRGALRREPGPARQAAVLGPLRCQVAGC